MAAGGLTGTVEKLAGGTRGASQNLPQLDQAKAIDILQQECFVLVCGEARQDRAEGLRRFIGESLRLRVLRRGCWKGLGEGRLPLAPGAAAEGIGHLAPGNPQQPSAGRVLGGVFSYIGGARVEAGKGGGKRLGSGILRLRTRTKPGGGVAEKGLPVALVQARTTPRGSRSVSHHPAG